MHGWAKPTAVVVAASLLLSMLYACGKDDAAAGLATIKDVTIIEGAAPTGFRSAAAPAVHPTIGDMPEVIEPLTQTVSVESDAEPAGALTVEFAVDQAMPTDGSVAMASAQNSDGPWELVEATVSSDGRTVTVRTNHLSFWTLVRINVVEALNALKDTFLGPISGELLSEAERPACAGEADARAAGMTIDFTGADAIDWCLGIDDGIAILKVVNRRRYPLELIAQNLTLLTVRPTDIGLEQLAQLGTAGTILLPFQVATFRVDDQNAALDTEMSGTAQSLYQLQVGLTTAAAILGRFGAGGGTIRNGAITRSQFDIVMEGIGRVFTVSDCLTAVADLNPASMLAKCLSPQQLYDFLGWKGFLLAPFIVAGGLLEFFRSEFNAFGDQLNGRDRSAIRLTGGAPPPADQEGPTWLAGVWTGEVYQHNTNGTYDVTIEYWGGPAGSIVGRVTYTQLNCGGDLRFESGQGDQVRLTEIITQGTSRCRNVVVLDLTRNTDGTVKYTFYVGGRAGGDVNGEATLHRTGDVVDKVPALFKGTWIGEMTQPSSSRSPYAMKAPITGGPVDAKVGTVEYADLACGGDWILREAQPQRLVVEENITYGSCLHGFLEITPAGRLSGRTPS